MIPIRGKILQGSGQGQNTLREQMPFFRDCFPEVSGCRAATINIRLEKPLIVLKPDFTTQSVPWHPAFKVVKGGEVFQFIRIRLGFQGSQPVDAWIYRAQFSPYREDPFMIEVLAPPIEFRDCKDVAIEILSPAHEGIVVGAVGDAVSPTPPGASTGPTAPTGPAAGKAVSRS